MSTCNRLDFANTRISTAYAQKYPRSLIGITTAGFAAFAFPLLSVISSLTLAQYSWTWKANFTNISPSATQKVILLVGGS